MKKSAGRYENHVAPGLRIDESRIEGQGCFAARKFGKGRRIAEYAGERISRHEIVRRVRGRRRLYICELNTYWAIDGNRGGNGTHFINHSCAPNAFLRVIKDRIVVFARRDIKAHEEITVDYIDTYHSDRKRCKCGTAKCRGTINDLKKKA